MPPQMATLVEKAVALKATADKLYREREQQARLGFQDYALSDDYMRAAEKLTKVRAAITRLVAAYFIPGGIAPEGDGFHNGWQ